MIPFTHLHCHSESSIDGLSPLSRLLDAAKQRNFDAIALTDHGNLSSSISFAKECQLRDLKPIHGLEAYVTLHSVRFHLTLLADGNKGFSTLVKLNNIGQKSADGGRPSIPFGDLLKHTEGVLVMTGCAASPLQRNSLTDAIDVARYLTNAFPNRVFAEAMLIGSSQDHIDRAMCLASIFNFPLILTGDVHFPYQTDAESHKVVSLLKAGFNYDSSDLWLATPEELLQRFAKRTKIPGPTVESAMMNAYSLSHALGVVSFDKKAKLPRVANAVKRLQETCTTWAKAKPSQYQERMQYELDVITQLGFASYFLILADIVEWARSKKIRVGPGRGSAVGSLVAYALGLTEIDPIEYGLSFDRFLNVKRAEWPDIDTDFESERREEVLQYVKEKWGGISIAAFSRWNDKSLIHDLSKHYHAPREMDEKAAEAGDESPAFHELVTKYPELGVTYAAAKGQVRHTGKHAGGVVLVSDEMDVPLVRTADGNCVVGWVEGEHRELTEAGVVKLDLLGLAALSVLRRLETSFGCRAAEPIDDSGIFSLFSEGKMTGIFQFDGSSGIIDFTRKVAPRTFKDLVAINALYRPGSLDSGSAYHFPEWRKSPRLLHPLVDDLLSETAGIFTYQEQVMEAYRRIVGGDLADADLARRVFAKARPGQPEWEAKMAKLKATFFKGAAERDITPAVASKLWGEISTSSRYSFNLSHAVAYSRIAWDLAWWKFNHPAAFYAESLSVGTENVQRFLYEAVSEGLQVVSPHVNFSTHEFSYDEEKKLIYLPLTMVQYLGTEGVAEIVRNAPFESLKDFDSKVKRQAVNARARLGLWYLGAFDGIPGTLDDLAPRKKKEMPRPSYDHLTKVEREQQFMGFILPTTELVEAVAKEKKRGRIAGIIYEKEARRSDYGSYNVYRMIPQGAWWHRGVGDWPIGAFVSVRVHAGNGKLLSIEEL